MTKEEIKKYDFAVFYTQGGGLARYVENTAIFVEAPPAIMGLTVGAVVPHEWGLIPANSKAEAMFAEEDIDYYTQFVTQQ